MSRGRVLVGIVAAGVAVVVILLAGVFSGSTAVQPLAEAGTRAATADQSSSSRLLEGFAAGDTVGLVRRLERRVEREPGDGDALAVLGLAYQQRARETGSPSFYGLSARALEQASAAGGPAPVIVQARASLANTRHRFADGLRLARRAIRLDPEDGSAYAALGDALLNLGRYDAAFAAYDRTARLSPGIPSYARVAHARELRGDTAAAAEAYELALETGSSVPEYVAWAKVQLGNLYFNSGQLARAAREYRDALDSFPGYVHARAALARVDAASGRYQRALRRLRRVVEALPVPAHVVLRGDVLHASGRTAEAREMYALVVTIERLFEANGVRTELQTALFDLDHDRRTPDALRRARLAHASAPGIYSADTVGWALFKSGRCGEARRYSERALRLGTKDALFYFHRAMIERCLGSTNARTWFERALGTNPYFSIRWAPVARAALAAP